LSSRVIVVTGAFGALGRAVVHVAMRQGARVALLDISGNVPADLMAFDPATARVFSGVDVTSREAAQVVMAAVNNHFGCIDALINVAGGFRWQTVQDGDARTWEELYRLNVASALNASAAALPFLRNSKAGRIVNIGAAAALKSAAGMGPYAASKSAVHRLTESLAEEIKGTGMTVNAVLPSIIDTPANRREMPDADRSGWVDPVAVAAVILFLASEAASAVTGVLLPVTNRIRAEPVT
jgi:NAD(P)-dependent dehydrogenase (short-subunit alcohol dehydrogenase family)